MDTATRFWNKVDRSGGPDACWPWTAGFTVGRRTKARGGKVYPHLTYGKFGLSAGKTVGAHRFAWESTNGPIPEGLCVCHRCDNPRCCNPRHFFLGTRGDNVHDAVQKNRIQHGEQSGRAKLTAAQVQAIRESVPGRTYRSLAEEYGITEKHVGQIVRGRSWARERV